MATLGVSNVIFKSGKPSSITFNVGAPTFCRAAAVEDAQVSPVAQAFRPEGFRWCDRILPAMESLTPEGVSYSFTSLI
jgi:hypothetical protein